MLLFGATLSDARKTKNDEIDDRPPIVKDDISHARAILTRAMRSEKAAARFFPEFGTHFLKRPGRGNYSILTVADIGDFDPFDPFDMAVAFGLNCWLRKVIREGNSGLYDRLFSFANVARLEHKSPLVVELLISIAAVTLTPIILTYGIMRAVARCKRLELDNELREAEVGLKREELKQRRIQTEILQELKTTVNDRISNQNLDIPDGVLVAATTISSPAVAELSTSPLIGSVTLGLTTKVGTS